MFFKTYYLGCLSHASYLIASETGDAALIDPRRDIGEYLTDAKAAGLTIRHVIETHLHADFVSGHAEAAAQTGAAIYLGAGSGATFAHTPVRHGDIITLGGDLTLRFLATPGHTPESVCVLAEPTDPAEPRLLFTGDTLFIGDVGRPDLANPATGQTPETMAWQLFASLQNVVLPLPDDTQILPAHGAGSSCGRALSDERISTLGKQKETNPALRFVIDGDETGFVAYATEGLDTAPRYFSHDVRMNQGGALPLDTVLGRARPLSPAEVEAFAEDLSGVVVDGRDAAAFGTAHVPGAVNIGLDGRFAPYVGAVLLPDAPLVVVAEPGRETEAMTRLARVGYENLRGFLAGGMVAWREAGGETATVPQVSGHELREKLVLGTAPPILDVRTGDEWMAGHIAGAVHIPLSELQTRLTDVPNVPHLAVICGSGYRSSIAASLLLRSGRRGVENISGGFAAYKKANGE